MSNDKFSDYVLSQGSLHMGAAEKSAPDNEDVRHARLLLRDLNTARDALSAAWRAREHAGRVVAEHQAEFDRLTHALQPPSLTIDTTRAEVRENLLDYFACEQLLLHVKPMLEAAEAAHALAEKEFNELQAAFDSPENEGLRWYIKTYNLAPAAPERVAPVPQRSTLRDARIETESQRREREDAARRAPLLRQREALQRELPTLRQTLARSDGAPSDKRRLAAVEEEIQRIDAQLAALDSADADATS